MIICKHLFSHSHPRYIAPGGTFRKSLADFDDRNKTKLARSVLPGCFCSFPFVSNSVLVCKLFFTRNSLTSKLLKVVVVQPQQMLSFLIAYKLLLIFLSLVNQLQTGLVVRHCERLQCRILWYTYKHCSSYHGTSRNSLKYHSWLFLADNQRFGSSSLMATW